MSKGYAEGSAVEERLAALERGDDLDRQLDTGRAALYGSTEAEPERHFLGWADELDADQLFASGEAWGLQVVGRSAVSRQPTLSGSRLCCWPPSWQNHGQGGDRCADGGVRQGRLDWSALGNRAGEVVMKPFVSKAAFARCARRRSVRRVGSLAAAVVLVALIGSGAAGAHTAALAPDGPGALSHFDLARKDCVGTARNTTSKVWYTVATAS